MTTSLVVFSQFRGRIINVRYYPQARNRPSKFIAAINRRLYI